MPWTAYIDGGSRGNPGPSAAGVQILDDAGRVIFSGGFFLGQLTNNGAEYNGLLAALDLLARAAASEIEIVSDSELMVRQINGEYKVRAAQLLPLYEEAKQRLKNFSGWKMRHVYREENSQADKLANDAMDARHDVVARDDLSLIERPEAPAATEPPAAAEPAETQVTVAVLDPPAENACPAKMRRGATFAFAARTPERLCVHACAGLLPQVIALQADPRLSPARAACTKADCGALFELKASPQ
jgi:probable phosphoglycerate mutase